MIVFYDICTSLKLGIKENKFGYLTKTRVEEILLYNLL